MGVLWTISAQLQGPWVTLLAVIVIQEIKKPWEKGWILFLWRTDALVPLVLGTYFYPAILPTDWDLTCKRRKLVCMCTMD
jgi:hypothetical protein